MVLEERRRASSKVLEGRSRSLSNHTNCQADHTQREAALDCGRYVALPTLRSGPIAVPFAPSELVLAEARNAGGPFLPIRPHARRHDSLFFGWLAIFMAIAGVMMMMCTNNPFPPRAAAATPVGRCTEL